MKPLLLQIYFWIFVTLTLCSCVSVKLTPEAKKASRLQFKEPSSPFRDVSLQAVDHAWKSEKTGNTISIFSDCTPTVMALEQVQQDMLATFPGAETLESVKVNFDEREALRTKVHGKLEGIPMKMDLLVYQKNGCRYSLNFTGRSQNFDSENSVFDKFIQGFSAP